MGEEAQAGPDRWRLRALGLGFAHSVVSLLAFPSISLWGMALLIPAPTILAALSAGARPKKTAFYFGVGTLPFWGWSHRWAWEVTAAGWAPMVLHLGLYSALAVWVIARLARAYPRAPLALTAAVGWGGAEFFRGAVLWDGYPWYLAAHPLIDASLLSWSASYWGAYGVSLLVAANAGAWIGLARRWRASDRRGPAVASLLVMAFIVASAAIHRMVADGEREAATTFRLALVTTNVPQSIKGGWPPMDRLGVLAALAELSRSAAAEDPAPDAIVWPETMFPGDAIQPEILAEQEDAGLVWILDAERSRAERVIAALGPLVGSEALLTMPDGTLAIRPSLFAEATLRLQAELGVPLLVGAGSFEGYRVSMAGGIETDWDARMNSVFLVERGRLASERYDKLKLTPFGEVMPYISAWPWLERQMLAVGAEGMAFDLSPGAGPTDFELPVGGGSILVATPVCFEATMSGVMRRLANQRGPGGERVGALVQLTNEGWLMNADSARLAHLQIARWRALELGLPIARCTNTGLSAGIDAYGGLVATGLDGSRGATRRAGVLTVGLPVERRDTVYAHVGDAIGWVSLGAVAVGIAWSVRRKDASGPRAREDH